MNTCIYVTYCTYFLNALIGPIIYLSIISVYLLFVSAPCESLNIHEDERMKPENWILLGWLPIIDATKSLRPTQGYEGSPARNLRLQHECSVCNTTVAHFLQSIELSSTLMELLGKQCILLLDY